MVERLRLEAEFGHIPAPSEALTAAVTGSDDPTEK
jgi:cytochrome c oxidase subunit 1